MRALGVLAVLGLVACAGPGSMHDGAGATPRRTVGSTAAPPGQSLEAAPAGSFAGAWQSCEGAPSPEECSRYLLVQRGDRICGTWSYLASGQAYEGKVVARASSPTRAQRTHVCGRPGAETDTPCSDGWQGIDKPLLLCDGRLGDTTGADGACFADYETASTLQGEWAALQAEPWMRECLSGNP